MFAFMQLVGDRAQSAGVKRVNTSSIQVLTEYPRAPIAMDQSDTNSAHGSHSTGARETNVTVERCDK